MSMPALVRLREALPDTWIALLTDQKLAELWQDYPGINEIIPFNKAHGVGRVSRTLRNGQYDAALIFPNSFRSAFEIWLAAIPVRVGYGRKMLLTHGVQPRAEHLEMHKRTPAEIKRLISQSPAKPRDTFPITAHHLHQYLRLVSFFGASEEPSRPALQISKDETTAFADKFGIDRSRPVLGLNPGAEYGPAKRWPAENFIQTAIQVSATAKVQWLVFGGAGDVNATASIMSAIRQKTESVHDLAGRTTLRELAVGLSICNAVLTNDTGPMHLASAVGTRVVVPFGSTSPELTGPGLPGESRHRLILGNVPCAPCFLRVCPIDLRCMNAIRVDQVAASLLDALRESPLPGRPVQL